MRTFLSNCLKTVISFFGYSKKDFKRVEKVGKMEITQAVDGRKGLRLGEEFLLYPYYQILKSLDAKGNFFLAGAEGSVNIYSVEKRTFLFAKQYANLESFNGYFALLRDKESWLLELRDIYNFPYLFSKCREGHLVMINMSETCAILQNTKGDWKLMKVENRLSEKMMCKSENIAFSDYPIVWDGYSFYSQEEGGKRKIIFIDEVKQVSAKVANEETQLGQTQ